MTEKNNYKTIDNQLKEKADKMATDILSSLGEKSNPIKGLLETYLTNRLKETYNEGIKAQKSNKS